MQSTILSAARPRPRGRLARRTVVAGAALALIVGVAFTVVLAAIDRLRDDAVLARQTEETLAAANHLERLVIDLESGLRGFLITGDERFLEPWNDARAAFPERAQALERLAAAPRTGHDDERDAHLIVQAGTSYIRDYSVPTVEAVRRDPASVDRAAATEEGKRQVDRLRASFDQFEAVEHGLAAGAGARAKRAARQAVVASSAGIAGSVLLVAFFTAYLTRTIVRPVRRAATMAGRLAGGDLAARLPETGPGEIGGLEAAFNTMGRSLETSHGELSRLVDEQGALRRVATLVARAVQPREVIEAVTAEVAGLVDAPVTWLAHYGSDGTATVVATWGEARLLEVQRGVRAPIVVDGQLWGIIGANWAGPVPAGVEQRLTQFTELVATAIANADSRAELNASRARVVAAADEARRRIERDLHDGIQQRLVALALDLRSAAAAVPSDLADLQVQLSDSVEGLNDTVDDLREISRGIHPAILSRGGLVAALKALARRSVVPAKLRVSVEGRLPERVEVALYYLVSEALTNVAKHAGASAVEIDLEAEEAVARVAINDDGIGGARPEAGSGLIGLRDRIEALGGRIEIASPDGEGTRLIAEIPLAER